MKKYFNRVLAITGFSVLYSLSPLVIKAETSSTASIGIRDASKPLPETVIPKARGKKTKFNLRHSQNLARIKEGPIDLLFLGDSITDRWSSSPLVWEKHFGKWNPANFGVGGDRTENVLWRLGHGELAGFEPKVVVLMIGTNNTHTNTPEDIVAGIKRIIEVIQEKSPRSKILLHAIFPREARVKNGKLNTMPMEKVRLVNKQLPKLAEPGKVEYMDISSHFLVKDHVPRAIMPDGVHLNTDGYEIWAKAIGPVLEKMMTEDSETSGTK